MNMKSNVLFVFAIAFGLAVHSAQASIKYSIECTNDWFSVSTSVMPIETVGTGWTAVPASGDVSVSSNKIVLDTDNTDPLTYSTNALGNVSRITTKLVVTLSDSRPDVGELTGAGAKTALCVYKNGSATNWCALINGEWADLSGVPVVGAEYEIVLDSDADDNKIRFLAKNLTASEAAYSTLTSGTDGWVANTLSAAISSVSFSGSTEISGLGGKVIVGPSSTETEAVLPVNTGSGNAAVTIPNEWLAANSITTSNASEAATAVTASGANGIAKWQSYVLGLTPSDAKSKPIVQPVQDTETGKVSFSLGNVAVRSEAGVPVKYCVKSYDTPACTGDSVDSGYVNSGESAKINLPSSGVKYYKLEIKFEN